MLQHKSLEAWKSAHQVVGEIFDPDFKAPTPSSWAIYDQLRRAALSVQLNVAEGYAMRTPRAIKRFLVIAYGSAIETGDLLELILEKKLGPADMVEKLLAQTFRTQRLLLGLIHRYQSQA
jgi:four helix bundle protein